MTAAKSVVVPLPPELVERLDREARRRVLGRRKLIELVLEAWLDEQANDPLIGGAR